MSFHNLLWLFPIAITLHDAEEAIFFPRWPLRKNLRHPLFSFPDSPGALRFGAAVLTLLAFIVTWLSLSSGKQSWPTYIVFGALVAMLANVFIPHIAASIVLRGYTPGVVTAAALNLPIFSLLVFLALRDDYVSGWKSVSCSIAVTLLLLLSIPALFKIGKLLKL